MFSVVVNRTKRSALSAGTVAVSLAAHLVVVAAIAAPSSNVPPPICLDCDSDWVFRPPEKLDWPPEEKRDSPAMERAAPAPTQPTTTPGLPAPDSATARIDSPGPGIPQPPEPGRGPAGARAATSAPGPRPPTESPDPLPHVKDSIFDPEVVEQLPRILEPREARRLLERVYPGMLRDAGVTGITTVVLVVDRNGAVEPGSVTVQETTHEAFREAAVRAAARFRFRPATVRGQPVAVWISLPIEWTVAP